MRKSLRYIPGNSFIHKLHPLLKLFWLVAGSIVVFIVQRWWTVYPFILLIWVALLSARVQVSARRGMRLFLTTSLMLFGFQAFFNQGGETVFMPFNRAVTSEGLETGAYVAGRFLAVILLSYLFILTTEPNDLVYAMMRAGLPYRYGFMLITALRLVPVFEQEGRIVYNAQLVRGVAYDARKPGRVLTLAKQFTMPLLTSALGKVDSLAVSMEGRCFGKYPSRTWLHTVKFERRDMLILIASLVLFISMSVFL